jgi:two-component system chemotaxis response regulator CheY
VDLPPSSTHNDTLLSVLLVEPSRTQAVIIRKYLQGLGIEPGATAPSGQAALEEMRRARPHVIVSAMHLKDMTGIDLARKVAAEGGIPAPGFVLISSESESQDAGSLSKAGKTAVLHKPFSIDQLAEALSQVAHRSLRPLAAAIASPEATLCEPIPGLGKTPVPAQAERRARVKVLLADDSSAARANVRGVLRDLGVTQVVEVPDGAQAVAAVTRETFDLVITDYNMPFLDGQGLVGYLRQNRSTAAVPIILVSTEQDPGKLEALRRLGITAICEKRFPPAVVREILDRLFP